MFLLAENYAVLPHLFKKIVCVWGGGGIYPPYKITILLISCLFELKTLLKEFK